MSGTIRTMAPTRECACHSCSLKEKNKNLLETAGLVACVVGALIGILTGFSFSSVDKPLGATTAFEYSAALAVKAAAPAVAENNAFGGGAVRARTPDPTR